MKKLLFTLFLILSISSVFAQDLKSLKLEAQRVFIASSEPNFDVIFETTYPKIFEIASKEEMKQVFLEILDNDEFSIKLLTADPNFEFGAIIKINNQKFCVVKHDNYMRLTFKTKIESPETLTAIFKSNMNAEEVTYNDALKSFDIKIRSTLVAVSDDLTNNKWKFVNLGSDDQLLYKIFSEEVIRKLEIH